jgi:hypothetical protein
MADDFDVVDLLLQVKVAQVSKAGQWRERELPSGLADLDARGVR